MTPLESLLAEVKAAEAKATKGPWISGVNGNMRVYGPDNSGELSGLLAVLIGSGERIADTRDFVAKSRTYVPTMVRVIEVLMEERKPFPHKGGCATYRSDFPHDCNCGYKTLDERIAAALAGSEGGGQ